LSPVECKVLDKESFNRLLFGKGLIVCTSLNDMLAFEQQKPTTLCLNRK
jgi:hypothetical protein